VLLDSKNRIWWGSGKSLTMLDMNNFKIPVKTPDIQLNRIEINEQFADYRHLSDSTQMDMEFDSVARFYNYPLNLELPYNRNHLTFHFSAIDWSAPHKVKYSFKMESLDDNWSHPAPEAIADYRSLPYGTYTFKVRAIGVAQKWSKPFEYTFTIHPPWWHSWWARTGYGITALLLIFGFVRWRTAKLKLRQKELVTEVRNATKEIRVQKEEVENQKDQILEQKKAITDSIQYASRIQTAILPPDEVLKYLLPKHFILYKPRDIVSGDFYWLTQKREKIIIVVADCTGHGVPGAFMSMLGNALLNDIVNNIKTLQASTMLNELRDQVMVSLRQTGKVDEAKDGMDLALCILDKENMALQYAGGFNSLYHIRNGKLTEIKADKMPIGIGSKAGKSFTNNELTLQKDDTLYMSSDGYVDQFGGPKGKKFMSTRFKQLLLDIQDKIMFEQKEILEQTLNEWMGITGLHEEKQEQIDDIIVMGIKI
jgi:serine phosphatase RsbU (regulator of sigma subunit)